MPDYIIRFYKDLEDSTGHSYHACQGEVTVSSAPHEEAAIAAAKLEFERRERLSNWRHHASSLECEALAKPPR